jgi:hypothetical protein
MATAANVQIGDIIKRWRKSDPESLTRDELASKMGCCVSTIRNLELGRDLKVLMLFEFERVKPGLLPQILEVQNELRPRRRVTNGHSKRSTKRPKARSKLQ